MNRLEQSLFEAAEALRALGSEFALIGGLAVSVRTDPRFTRDADLAVAVESDRAAEKLVHDLSARHYRVAAQVEQESTGRLATVRLLPPGARDSGLVVDLLFASSGIEAEVVAAAEELLVSPGLQLPVATLAHLVALKVLSRNDTNRPQDRADLVALIARCGEQDLSVARDSLALIESRGFARGKSLGAELDVLLAELGR